MPQTVTIEDELAQLVREEADRRYNGKVEALVSEVLGREMRLQEGLRGLEQHGGGGGSEPEMIARAMASAGISTSHLEAVADTLRQAAGLAPGFRDPGTPQDYLNHFIGYAASSESAQVACVLTTAQAAGGEHGQQREGIVSHAQGLLRFVKPGISGDLRQTFSDRTTKTGAPFDAGQSEQLGMAIAVDATSGLPTIELTAHAWGDARQTLTNLSMRSGVLLADGASIGNQTAGALYILSLGTVYVPG